MCWQEERGVVDKVWRAFCDDCNLEAGDWALGTYLPKREIKNPMGV
jgi:hypothetical protein